MNAQSAIVIGGGIAGCVTAHALAIHNIKVTLIERHDKLATEASGNPFAILYPRLTGQNTPLEALNIHGFFHTLKLLNSLSIERCQYQGLGVVQLASNDKLQKQQDKLAEIYKNADMQFKQLNSEQLSQIAGTTLNHSGLYFPQAGGINLAHLCHVLVANSNITVLPNTDALQINQTAESTWQVFANDKKTSIAEAENIVIANANDATKLSQTKHLPLVASRGQLSYLNSNESSKNLRTIICGDGYITPAINQLHYLGATFSTQDNATELRTADHESNLQLLKNMSDPLYENLQKNVVSGRVAWRCQTTDYLPVAGQLLDVNALKNGKFFYNDSTEKLPWFAGLYVNVGHGAKGFLSAPICAEVIASSIAKNTENIRDTLPTNLLSALQPGRFILRELGFKALAQKLSV